MVTTLIVLALLLLFGLPTGIWFAIGARRAAAARPPADAAPEPRYGDQGERRRPNQLGTALARQTTYLD